MLLKITTRRQVTLPAYAHRIEDVGRATPATTQTKPRRKSQDTDHGINPDGEQKSRNFGLEKEG